MDSVLDIKDIKDETDAVQNEHYPHYNKDVNYIQNQVQAVLKDELNILKFETTKECVEITIDDIRSSEDEGKDNERLEQQVTNNIGIRTGEYGGDILQESKDNNANNQCDEFYFKANLSMGETLILNDPNPTGYIKSYQNKINTKTGGIIRRVASNEYIVTKDGKYQCTYCAFSSTAKRPKRSMTKHIEGCHRKESPMYQCPHCPYKSFYSLKSHLLYKHTSEKDIQWYQCDKCNTKYKTKPSLRKHLYTHFNFEELRMIEKNECSICGAAFRCRDHIKRHVRFVHNKEKMNCENCDFSTSNKCTLKHHIQVTHSECRDLQIHRCQHCNYRTKFMQRLKAHTRKQHTNTMIICEICGYTCKTQLSIKLHRITHQKNINEKELKYRCNKCNYKTYRLNNLTVHKLNHLKPSEIKYFYCYHCEFKAKRKDNLKTHVLRHFKKEEVTLWCYLCDFSTKRRNLLSEHLSTKHGNAGEK